MDKERWAELPWAKGNFVSNYGNVKRNGRILAQTVSSDGYHRVSVKIKKGVFKYKPVHRLVAECFIRPPKDGEEINHKDGNTHNNHVSNLEWCDRKYNVWHRDNVILNGGTKRCTHKVKCVETGVIYDSPLKAERATGIWNTNITRAARLGIMAGKYHWERLEL